MKWEYRTIRLGTHGFLGGKVDDQQLEAMMNSLGESGWELVTAFDTNQAYGETRDVVVLFKKEKK